MTYEEILQNARERMKPRCKVCKECNGIACVGMLPGPAGKGKGHTFQRNCSYLSEHIKIHMNVLYDESKEIDTSVTLFDKTFSTPIFPAPIGMVDFTYTPVLNDETYSEAVVLGAKQAGSIAFTGGGIYDHNFYYPLEVTKKYNGWAIPTLKPWTMDIVEQRVPIVEQAGVFAFCMDVDGVRMRPPESIKLDKELVTKSQEDIKRIVNMTKLPFIVKGIMTAKEAVQVVQAGAYGIVISNHGGRVMEDGLSTAEVLSDIKKAVGDTVKIWIDGGIRTGGDVFKMLALGADAVLIGRPYAIAAYGGGAEGVKLYTEKITWQLKETMKMSGCYSLKEITREHIAIV